MTPPRPSWVSRFSRISKTKVLEPPCSPDTWRSLLLDFLGCRSASTRRITLPSDSTEDSVSNSSPPVMGGYLNMVKHFDPFAEPGASSDSPPTTPSGI